MILQLKEKMKFINTRLNMFSRFTVLAVMIVAAVLCNINSANAQLLPAVKTLNFGIIDITRGQTARLNVIYTKVETADPNGLPPDPYVPPDPYRVTLSFIARDGRVVAQKVVSLEIGKAALLDYAIVDPNGGNAGVRAVVAAESNVRTNTTPIITPTVEVFNVDTGQTSVLDPGSIYSFNPQPDPPGFGFFGIARNQTARLNVAYVGFHNPPGDHNPPDDRPGPVNVTMRFVNGDGSVMAETTRLVEFGKAVSFDFPAGAFPAGLRQRLRAVVIASPDANGIVPCVMPSVEVLNNDTGKTAVFYPGQLN